MGESLTVSGAGYGFFFVQSLCNGCKACQVACKDKHDLPLGVNWRRVVEYTGGFVAAVGEYVFCECVFVLHVGGV